MEIIIADHELYVVQLGYGDETQILFNKHGFVMQKEVDDRPFYDSFVHGQGFQELLDISVMKQDSIRRRDLDIPVVDYTIPPPHLLSEPFENSTSVPFSALPEFRDRYAFFKFSIECHMIEHSAAACPRDRARCMFQYPQDLRRSSPESRSNAPDPEVWNILAQRPPISRIFIKT